MIKTPFFDYYIGHYLEPDCEDIKMHGGSKKDWKELTVFSKMPNKRIIWIIKYDILEYPNHNN